MKYSTRLTLAIASLTLVAASQVPTAPIALKDGSRVWFDGTSTVRSWSCKATQINATIDGAVNAATAVLAGEKAVATVELAFPTAQLDCENRTMNGHMMKALNADQHAQIRFTLTDYTLTAGSPASGQLQGTLLLNGQSHPIAFPATFASADGALRVTGAYELKMTDWGVEPPRLMLGTLRVGEMITVNFDLLLQP